MTDKPQTPDSTIPPDIANSTSLAVAAGDRVWVKALAAHLEIVTDCIQKQGGELVKSLGDGTMSAFRPARAAMTAALELQALMRDHQREPPMEIRIGIHTGDVIKSRDDFFGSVVNKAARIADTAHPGDIRGPTPRD